ncbi:glycosyl hydrolase 53 family protein [Cohnella lupini]|uniref:Arabinogalactan endo-beta-1,4-galactanase n=1 Tax=Cohnella lupini TaxID=1294267 RepID=A0A3D9IQA7_9BACL|nr:glycosyl hydrolase 53 family protein [Cohnella lupini]RED63970.1 arabinogalactan endo-1,4-beta-galactosidase [Cohnella lupini]
MERRRLIWRKGLSAMLAVVLTFVTIASTAGLAPRTAEAASDNLVSNPGFEESWDFTDITDWVYSGTGGAIKDSTDSGHPGRVLEHYASSAYSFKIEKTISGLTPGHYKLGVSEMGNAGQFRLYIRDHGDTKKSVSSTHAGWQNWRETSLNDISVTNETAVIGMEVTGNAGDWGVLDDVWLYKLDPKPTWRADSALEATHYSASSVRLDWSRVNESTSVTYNVYKNGVVQATTTNTTLDIDGLSPETQYTFNVEASFDNSQWTIGGPSTTITTATSSATAPSWTDDAYVTASSLTSRGVVLDWSGASDNDGVTSYRIYRNNVLKASVTGSTYQMTDLSPGTPYTFRIEAGNSSSLWSNDGPEIDIRTADVASDDFVKGADISTLQAIEDAGGKYFDNGVERDLLAILKDKGVNYIRLRIWNNPVQAEGYNDKAHTVELAKRVKDAGLKLLLDFHYSDFWTDPGNQVKPAAWENLHDAELNEALYDYTADVMNALKAVNAYPDMVQIGNEINPGMMLPDGAITNYDKLARLLSSGIKAVRDTTPAGHDVKTMIHLAEGGDNGQFRSFFDAMKARNVDYDVIGLSFYPYWHGTFKQLKDNLNDLAVRFGKELIVVETAHPFTLANGDGWGNIANAGEAEKAGFPATPQGQADSFTMVLNTLAHTVDGKGAGAFYWEPAWIPVGKDANGDYQAGWKTKEGNAWDNQAMFDFQGNALPSLNAFGFNAGELPARAAVKVMPVDGITVPANELAQTVSDLLPTTAGVLFNEGSIEQSTVTWQSIEQDRLSRIGTFTVTGTVADTGMTARIDITVTSYKNMLKNPGFEAATTANDWTITGDIAATKVETNAGNAGSGQRALNYWYGSDFAFKLSQTVAGLHDGVYTLKAHVSGEDPADSPSTIRLFAESYGADRQTSEPVINTGWNNWHSSVIENIHVTNGQASIGIEVEGAADAWGYIDDLEFFKQVSVPEWTSAASLTVSDITKDSLKLSWAGLAESESTGDFKIYRDGALLTTATGTSKVITGLTPNTSYSFKVEASSDSSIWTSDGPSAQAKTLAEPGYVFVGGGSTPIESFITLKPEQLSSGANGHSIVELPSGVTEVRLPVSLLEGLSKRVLTIGNKKLSIDIPASVFAALETKAGSKEGYVSVKLTPLDPAGEWLTRAKERSNGDIATKGDAFDLGLSLVGSDGTNAEITEFDEAIVLRFKTEVDIDPAKIGIYYVANDGSLEYVGGVWKDGILTAQTYHFSRYAALELKIPFSDVPSTHWAFAAVDTMASKLYVNGTAAGRFDPARKITRAEFTAMLARALRLKQVDASDVAQPFGDVKPAAWYAESIAVAYSANIVSGIGAGSFGPSVTISREEMAVMAIRAHRYLNEGDAAIAVDVAQAEDVSFKDADNISIWANASIKQVLALGLMQGQGNERFSPRSTATRAEAAVLLSRLLSVME